MSKYDGIQDKIGNGLESQVKGKNGGVIVFGIAALAVVGWVAVKITEIVAPLLIHKDTDIDSNVCSDDIYDNGSGDDVDYSGSDDQVTILNPSSN